VLAAVLRVMGLDAKGFWQDEAYTIIAIEPGFGGMLETVVDREITPPLYYVVAWTWTQVFGTGEVGIRSLSALAGTAAVPIAYLAAKELVSRRAGLVTALLVAVNPLLVWYGPTAGASRERTAPFHRVHMRTCVRVGGGDHPACRPRCVLCVGRAKR
jgi:mannosyltransferase